MKKFLGALFACLLFSASAFGQEAGEFGGMPDSVVRNQATRVLLVAVPLAQVSSFPFIFNAPFSAFEIDILNATVASGNPSLQAKVYAGGAYQSSSYQGVGCSIGNSNDCSSELTGVIGINDVQGLTSTVGASSETCIVQNFNKFFQCKLDMEYSIASKTGPEWDEGIWTGSAPVTGFEFILSSSFFAGGYVRIYGLL